MPMDNPRWQRMQQRIAALQPHQRALLSTAQNELSGQVAAADAQEDLRGRRAAFAQQQADRQYGLSRDSLDLAQDQFSAQKKDAHSAERLGMANIALSGGLGYLDMQRKAEQERRLNQRLAKWDQYLGGM